MKNLIHTEGRIIVKADLESKNSWKFASGQTIKYARGYNNFNRRETQPVNAICISGENVPRGTEVICHLNAITDTHRIFDHSQLSGDEESSSEKYYSIPEHMAFLWLDQTSNTWRPIPPYETALRVFKPPHRGLIEGIDAELIPDVLYVTSGDLMGKVVMTLKACDYQVVFQDKNGREGNIIRFRPHGDEKENREPEAICVMNSMTDMVNEGKLWVGITIGDAQPKTGKTKRLKSNKKILIPK